MRPESFEIIDQITRLGQVERVTKGTFGNTHPVSESRHVGTRSHPS